MSKLHRCIVIGASAGGVEALKQVAAGLPGDLAVPVFVVLHISPWSPSLLTEILGNVCPLPVCCPQDGEEIRGGAVYVASPDHHLLIEGGKVGVKRGPKENGFRPSIDALFRSAAYTCGAGAVGVVLSGALHDGTSGLWSIKQLGGTAVVQHPDEAQFDSMPLSALEYVAPDYLLPASEMGTLLGRLAAEPLPAPAPIGPDAEKLLAAEVAVAAGEVAIRQGIMEMGTLTPFTCPECHGTLTRIGDGPLSRFRCHTGHAYTDSALLAAVMDSTGEMIWQVVRSLEEGIMLLSGRGTSLKEAGDPVRAEIFLSRARLLEQQSKTFQKAAVEHGRTGTDNGGQKSES
ncbi:MAG: chemotaxis protein CheB [Verrucomicrobiales bacterium]|nr:chemotaxis protein CheB [Verrucomicrobiales bacterium]